MLFDARMLAQSHDSLMAVQGVAAPAFWVTLPGGLAAGPSN
jgi:hypothetical protein